ncbi:hypothetical protein GGS23DRAFT_620778 [Durotheca rogersii]|uniref:uncharacterized protein n=1 Tax=Durotheca rogersii TaxID=419775 RepID=UPI00221FA12B|nr:uncharacterized protein GGS23DRAFT_620778 [Durotheca rogersii]KAI5863917.1 hypothetical protein GGS23DRAFT_620778 [Durotheca rogersii]
MYAHNSANNSLCPQHNWPRGAPALSRDLEELRAGLTSMAVSSSTRLPPGFAANQGAPPGHLQYHRQSVDTRFREAPGASSPADRSALRAVLPTYERHAAPIGQLDSAPDPPAPQQTGRQNDEADAVYDIYRLPQFPLSFVRPAPGPKHDALQQTDLRHDTGDVARAYNPPAWRAHLGNQDDSSCETTAPERTYPLGGADVDAELHYARLWRQQMAAAGMSPRYRGNPWVAGNRSADVPEGLNTALWVTNLPPGCTHGALLGAIRGCGKVFAAVLSGPEEGGAGAGGGHATSAAKLVFFSRAGAERLATQARAGRFAVQGYAPRVRPNRVRSAPRPPGPQSRVLHVRGPPALVGPAALLPFFADRFRFDLEAVVPLPPDRGPRAALECRFASYRCQAQAARRCIAREKEWAAARAREARDADAGAYAALWAQVTVRFGVDPCA